MGGARQSELFLPTASGPSASSAKVIFAPGLDAIQSTFTPIKDAIKLKAATKLFAALRTAKRLAAKGNRGAQLSLKYYDNEQAFVNIHLKYGNNEVVANVRTRDDLARLTSPPLKLHNCPFFCAYLKLVSLPPTRPRGSLVPAGLFGAYNGKGYNGLLRSSNHERDQVVCSDRLLYAACNLVTPSLVDTIVLLHSPDNFLFAADALDEYSPSPLWLEDDDVNDADDIAYGYVGASEFIHSIIFNTFEGDDAYKAASLDNFGTLLPPSSPLNAEACFSNALRSFQGSQCRWARTHANGYLDEIITYGINATTPRKAITATMAADGYKTKVPTRPIANTTALSYSLVVPYCLTNHIAQHVALPMPVVEKLGLVGVGLTANTAVPSTIRIRLRTSTSPLPSMGSTEDARVLTAWEIILSADDYGTAP